MQFDFGQNWKDYSAFAITPERVAQAREDFNGLLAGIDLRGKTFLDIGFGQGFGLLSAAAAGARTVGCDINPKCGDVVKRNKGLFPELADREIEVIIGSVLDPAIIAALRANPLHGSGGFDIVHSWGVLHHTGNMRQALANAAGLVRPGGHLVIAIYNLHWSSPIWRWIKWFYCKSPTWMKRSIIAALYPVIWLAKLLVTRKNPKDKARGMDFYYDVVDWVGGFPYEYASVERVESICHPHGLELLRCRPAEVPTGCNEFIFKRGQDQLDSDASASCSRTYSF
jgi:2-polyprenyl-3-methyl-5-hydroxy-6-metoxy-1,4-benzoquinol methylase